MTVEQKATDIMKCKDCFYFKSYLGLFSVDGDEEYICNLHKFFVGIDDDACSNYK